MTCVWKARVPRPPLQSASAPFHRRESAFLRSWDSAKVTALPGRARRDVPLAPAAQGLAIPLRSTAVSTSAAKDGEMLYCLEARGTAGNRVPRDLGASL